MKEYNGYVSNIIYRNDTNGFTIFEIVCDDMELTCKGNISSIDVGANIELTGEKTIDPRYGEEIRVYEYNLSAPEDSDGLKYYLGSGAIRGIGETMATRIVDRFGSHTLKILENEPERLSEIKGISEKKARDIAIQFREKTETREAMIFLQKYGITNNMAIKIYEEYGKEIYTLIAENPYKLVEDIRGIGFKTADDIATKSGVKVDSQYRIRAGLMYVLSSAISEGHMYLPMELLKDRSAKLLSVTSDLTETEISNLSMERKVVVNNDKVYIADYYYAELKCASMLRDLNMNPGDIGDPDEDMITEYRIDNLEKELNMKFDALQREAIKSAISNGILIISGGPGTGKTTIINALIRYFMEEGLDIMLAAPTGRAAKRMSEATGYEAKTIHRLLELSGAPDEDHSRARFERNEFNPLETDAVILDEMSMVDIFLFQSLLKAIVPGTRLIMVGDVDQLPSVGPGQVLKDLMASGAFKVVTLETIFRQEKGSDIVINAHDIRSGKYPKMDNDSKDFFFLERNDQNVIYKHMVQLITEKLPGYVGARPIDIQVLTPVRKGPLGVETLNHILQRFINPESSDKKEIEHGDYIFREGDKVMQIKNNYQLEWSVTGKNNIVVQSGTGVFNGDLGVIKEIDDEQRFMLVEYEEGHEVRYDYQLLDEIELAYAVTIHKSQGSEYPAVVIPLLSGPPQLMNRNLLYTAITRAKTGVVILGRKEMVESMVDNDHVNMRYTGLEERIREVCL
ncbi:MAG: ATP-dependent RecD-like DNA helicase [Lachnospiraceae bacterium]|nr:ATP-dependent RecD-like DNA helicase [Lachnospiraceae bacterium]